MPALGFRATKRRMRSRRFNDSPRNCTVIALGMIRTPLKTPRRATSNQLREPGEAPLGPSDTETAPPERPAATDRITAALRAPNIPGDRHEIQGLSWRPWPLGGGAGTPAKFSIRPTRLN